MLSSKPNQFSQAHRRQNSMPAVANTPEKASYPPPANSHQQHSGHRRGLSVDVSMLAQNGRPLHKQDIGMVSNTPRIHQQQHDMRAAQLPAMPRPGPEFQHKFEPLREFSTGFEEYANLSIDCGSIDPQSGNTRQPAAEAQRMSAFQFDSGQLLQDNRAGAGACDPTQIEMERQSSAHSETPRKNIVQDCRPMTPSSNISSVATRRPLSLDLSLGFLNSETIRASHSTPMKRGRSDQSSFGFLDSETIKASHSTAMKRGRSDQNSFGFLDSETIKVSQGTAIKRGRSIQNSFGFLDSETIKASHGTAMKRGRSDQDSTIMTKKRSVDMGYPEQPNAALLQGSMPFDIAPGSTGGFVDISMLNEGLFNLSHGYSSSDYSPMTNNASPSMSSFQSSPDLPPVSLFGTDAQALPNFPALAQQHSLAESGNITNSKKKGSPRKAVSSNPQSEDESNFNPMDYIVNDTGITEEQINAHIEGPNEDGKYKCLFDACPSSLFGRKENVRAHVQTHLDDRRFRCDACTNRFVRPNDLKRHWNIHLNKRNFECICKASFNRHDALKRHRERNEWCASGGTRGSPDSPKKEEKKRGRPRKVAPTESQERRERKALIRRQVQAKKASAASSIASDKPSPRQLDFTPPASPDNRMGDIFTPVHCHQDFTPGGNALSPPPTRGSTTASTGLSTMTEENMFGDDPFGESEAAFPSQGSVSQFGSPPELDLMSSSPSTRFLDFGSCSEEGQQSNPGQGPDFFDDINGKGSTDLDLQMFPLFGEVGNQDVPSDGFALWP